MQRQRLRVAGLTGPQWLAAAGATFIAALAVYLSVPLQQSESTSDERVAAEIALQAPRSTAREKLEQPFAPALPDWKPMDHGSGAPPGETDKPHRFREFGTRMIDPLRKRGVELNAKLEKYASEDVDLREVIPAQVKRYKEPEAVLTLIRALKDPAWAPFLREFLQSQWGFGYTREWLNRVELSLGVGPGFGKAATPAELQRLLLAAETSFEDKSIELRSKFALDAIAGDAGEAAMTETLIQFLEAYRYWSITKDREDIAYPLSGR
jgi:hypothetical protein